jgi:hypothetical protein
MNLREILNVTHSWLLTTFDGAAVAKWFAEVEADNPEAQARLVAQENEAGMKALSAVAALPRAGR